jgi:hypothetical protein
MRISAQIASSASRDETRFEALEGFPTESLELTGT